MHNVNKLRTKTEFVSAFIACGQPPICSDYEYEQIRWELLRQVMKYGQDVDNWAGGLFTLFFGVANWGVDWAYYDSPPPDPAGKKWAGPRGKKGKHVLDGGSDFPWGGLGLAHLDSSALYRDAYRMWGVPYKGAMRDKAHFNKLIKSKHAKKYYQWADNLLSSPHFLVWVCTYWLQKFWAPAWQWVWLDLRARHAELDSSAFYRAALNARISNSASGIASNLRKNKILDPNWRDEKAGSKEFKWVVLDDLPSNTNQEDTYLGYKYLARSEKSMKRTFRQISYIKRASVVYDTLAMGIL